MKHTWKLLLLMGVAALAARSGPRGGGDGAAEGGGSTRSAPTAGGFPGIGTAFDEITPAAAAGRGSGSGGALTLPDVANMSEADRSAGLEGVDVAQAMLDSISRRIDGLADGYGAVNERVRLELTALEQAVRSGSVGDLDRIMSDLVGGPDADRRFAEAYERFSTIHDDPEFHRYRDQTLQQLQEGRPDVVRRAAAVTGILMELLGNPTTGVNPTLGDVAWNSGISVVQEAMGGERPGTGILDVPVPGQGAPLESTQVTTHRRREDESDDEYFDRTGVRR
jgi:hypothetical protein